MEYRTFSRPHSRINIPNPRVLLEDSQADGSQSKPNTITQFILFSSAHNFCVIFGHKVTDNPFYLFINRFIIGVGEFISSVPVLLFGANINSCHNFR